MYLLLKFFFLVSITTRLSSSLITARYHELFDTIVIIYNKTFFLSKWFLVICPIAAFLCLASSYVPRPCWKSRGFYLIVDHYKSKNQKYSSQFVHKAES